MFTSMQQITAVGSLEPNTALMQVLLSDDDSVTLVNNSYPRIAEEASDMSGFGNSTAQSGSHKAPAGAAGEITPTAQQQGSMRQRKTGSIVLATRSEVANETCERRPPPSSKRSILIQAAGEAFMTTVGPLVGSDKITSVTNFLKGLVENLMSPPSSSEKTTPSSPPTTSTPNDGARGGEQQVPPLSRLGCRGSAEVVGNNPITHAYAAVTFAQKIEESSEEGLETMSANNKPLWESASSSRCDKFVVFSKNNSFIFPLSPLNHNI